VISISILAFQLFSIIFRLEIQNLSDEFCYWKYFYSLCETCPKFRQSIASAEVSEIRTREKKDMITVKRVAHAATALRYSSEVFKNREYLNCMYFIHKHWYRSVW